ncbi:MAG: hypothetical protein U1F36_20635 [Planctomycetota bacterium]
MSLKPDETRAGNIMFRAPDGWQRGDLAERILLVPKDLGAGQRCWIEVLPGRPLDAGFEKAFDQLFESQIPRGERDRCGEVAVVQSAGGLTMRQRWIVHRPSFEPDMLCTLVVAWRCGDRMEAVAYTARNWDHFDHYAPAFSEFVQQRVRFANQIVLAAGEPKLTMWDVEGVADMLAWGLDTPLGEADRAELRRLYVEAWKEHASEARDDIRQVIDVRRQVDAMEPSQREQVRVKIEEEALPEWRKDADKDKLAAFVVHLYDAARTPIAEGKPPLTRAISDASCELLAFMIREVRGGKLQPDANMRDQWAAGLCKRWGDMTASEREGISHMPMQWSALRIAWPAIDETQREGLRSQWRQQLGPMLGSMGASGGVDAGPLLSDRISSNRMFASTLNTMYNATITQMAGFARMGGNDVSVRYR